MLAALILAAGESSRMGSPKALLPFPSEGASSSGSRPNPRTFLEHLLEVIRAATTQPGCGRDAGRVIGWTRVVLGAHVKQIRSRVVLEDDAVVINPAWREGQLSSIQAAIRSLAEQPTDGILLFLVDHPLVSPALAAELIRRFYASGSAIVAPVFRGKRGHPVIFARRLYPELLEAPAEKGARAVVWTHASEVLEVPTEEEGVILNFNDPASLRRVSIRTD